MNTDEHLIIIAKLTPGDTINCSTLEIVTHNSWYACLSRAYNREDRLSTVTWVEISIRQALIGLDNIVTNSIYQVKLQRLISVTNGIRNLMTTYHGCEDIIHRLQKLIDDIDCRVARDTRTYCRVCHATHFHSSQYIEIPNMVIQTDPFHFKTL